jgi:UDP-N-acetylglucosamine acyltransferase
MIHPTAMIHGSAEVPADAEVGPYTVIEAGVVMGPGCRIGPHVHLRSGTTLGAGNLIHAGCVLGDDAQDKNYRGQPTRLRIGAGNVFREHVTVHRANKPEEETVVGSQNYLMAGSHVGHNATLGDHVVLANGALVAGHVQVADRAFISGHCLIHQFVRVGLLALMQGGAGISKDLPPFTIARGDNRICGLNIVGMRRAGYSAEIRLELKRLYHALFRRGANLREAVESARGQFQSEAAKTMLEFISASRRGICRVWRNEEEGLDEESDAGPE